MAREGHQRYPSAGSRVLDGWLVDRLFGRRSLAIAPSKRELILDTVAVQPRSPDEAKRNPGTISQAGKLIPDYASLHPGYD